MRLRLRCTCLLSKTDVEECGRTRQDDQVEQTCYSRRDEPPSSGARKGNKSNEEERRKRYFVQGRLGSLTVSCRDGRCKRQGKWAETGKDPTLDLCRVPAAWRSAISHLVTLRFFFSSLPSFSVVEPSEDPSPTGPMRQESSMGCPTQSPFSVPPSGTGESHVRMAPWARETGLACFSFFASLDGTDGVAAWQETGRHGQDRGEGATWPSWIFPGLSPRAGECDDDANILLMMMTGGWRLGRTESMCWRWM